MKKLLLLAILLFTMSITAQDYTFKTMEVNGQKVKVSDGIVKITDDQLTISYTVIDPEQSYHVDLEVWSWHDDEKGNIVYDIADSSGIAFIAIKIFKKDKVSLALLCKSISTGKELIIVYKLRENKQK